VAATHQFLGCGGARAKAQRPASRPQAQCSVPSKAPAARCAAHGPTRDRPPLQQAMERRNSLCHHHAPVKTVVIMLSV